MTPQREIYADRLEALFKDPGYRPMRSRDMARRLNVPRDKFHAFRSVLEEIRRSGRINRGDDSLWRLPGDAEKPLLGRLDVARAGHAFLIPDDPEKDDIFIAADRMLDAFDGDRVRVRLIHDRRSFGDRRPSAKVVEVVERARTRLVGTILENGMAEVDIPPGCREFAVTLSPDAPGRSASQAAKSQRRRRRAGQREGDSVRALARGKAGAAAGEPLPVGQKALLEVAAWPNDPGGPRAGIIEILGPAGDPDTETAAILAEHGAPGPFPEPVRRAARRLAREFSPEELAGRLDLTGDFCCTIDPPDARDFDDALGIKRGRDGSLTVDIHIADVGRYVKPGSELDLEARERSTSVYLPERVIPMLPEEISNDLCSLRPDEIRPAKTARIRFAPDGERLDFSIHRSLIRSRRRFTYGEVRDILAARERGEPPSGGEADAAARLFLLHDLAMNLRRRRLDNGAIELNLMEYRVNIDDEGRAESLERVEHDSSHQLVEEYMLAANVVLAEWAAANGLPVLHRQHPPPKPERLEELANYLIACGYPFKPPFNRKKLMATVAKAAGRPEEHAINLMILKSFQQAGYSPDPAVGHFALNFPKYAHFTSPIRRYPDLRLHQALDLAFAAGGEKSHKLAKKLRRPVAAVDNLENLGAHCSARERRAMRIEEAVKDFRRLELLSRADGREFSAVVTGIRKFGVFVELAGYFVEGLLSRADLAGKGRSAREDSPPRVRGRGARTERPRLAGDPGFHIGQAVKVRLAKVDLPARRCELEFIGDL